MNAVDYFSIPSLPTILDVYHNLCGVEDFCYITFFKKLGLCPNSACANHVVSYVNSPLGQLRIVKEGPRSGTVYVQMHLKLCSTIDSFPLVLDAM